MSKSPRKSVLNGPGLNFGSPWLIKRPTKKGGK
jgi:hypothetical protein